MKRGHLASFHGVSCRHFPYPSPLVGDLVRDVLASGLLESVTDFVGL
jgi:hypothetical protein